MTDVAAANITVGGTVTQVFGEVTGTGVNVSGKIDTGAATRIFSAVGAPVTVTGGIEADSVEQVFGAATKKITTGDINITGNAGIVFNAVTDVKAANITVNGTVTQVFGEVTGTGVEVSGKIAVNGNADKIFDSVKAPVSVKQGISTEYTVEGQAVRGDVGQVFGAITLGQNKTVDVKGITVGNITGSGVIASVGAANDANAGTITLGVVNVKDVGASGTTTAKLIGNVKGGAVTTTSITAGNVYGNVFGDVDATVTTGNISVTTLSAQLAGTVKGTLQGTESTTKATISLGSALGNLVTKVDTNAVLKNYSVINVESITNNVIPSVAGTVQNFAVTATATGTMSAPLVGNELTGTLNAVTVDVHSAAVTTNNGILVNSVNASASVIGCRVEADEVSSSAATFGGLTGTNKGTLTGNTVTIGTLTATGTEAIVGGLVGNNSGKIAAVNGQNVTADTATQVSITTLSGGKTVGGLVGSNSGTINCSNTVKTVNVTISTNAAKVGGLTGVNTGTITGTDVTASISYTGTGGTTIGGIVGEMNGGTLNGAKAGGIINVDSTTSQSGKGNIIGGAVGKDVGNAIPAVYSNVHSTVKVAAAWANGTTKSVTVPGGMGAVGKFVGYVNNGSFTNCSGMDNSTDFWFMGELAVKTNESYKLASDGYALTSETTKFPTITSYQTANARSEWIATNGRAKDTVYVHYAVTKLEGCTFDLKSVAGTHTVTLGKEYYHTGETRDITYYSANKVTPANPFTKVSDLAYDDFASNKDKTEKTKFYLNISGNYYQLYSKYTTKWEWIGLLPVEYHVVTLYADTNMNGTVDSGDWSNSTQWSGYITQPEQITNAYTYTRPDALAAGTYLIVNGNANQALGMEGTAASSIAISSTNGSVAFNDIEQASLVKNGIWTLAVNEDGTYTWKRGANYLNVTESGISGTSSAVSMGADVLIPNPTAYNFRTSGGYSLTYADGAFKQTGSAGQVGLFKVNAPNGPVYELLINSYVGYGDLCGYSTAKAAALSEETIPAEEIGGETGNNT